MLGSVVFAIARSYMSAGLLVLAVFVQMGGALLLDSVVCAIATSCWTTCLICVR